MMKINELVVCTHGRFGEEMIRSAEMIVGPMEHIHAFSLMPGMSQDDYLAEIASVLSPLKDHDILVIADLFGGTPCNTMARLLKDYSIHIVTGLNLGMLIEVYSMLKTSSVKELSETAKQISLMTCVDVNEKMGITFK